MLKPGQSAQSLYNQIIAAYYSTDPQSELLLARLTKIAMETMPETEWTALCAECGAKPGGPGGHHFKKSISLRLEFKLADCWIGVYWSHQGQTLHVWICLLPTLPIHIQIAKGAH